MWFTFINMKSIINLNFLCKTLFNMLYLCCGSQNDNSNNNSQYNDVEDDNQEQQQDAEFFKQIKKLSFIDINDWPNILEILDKADDNLEFPFVLFIAINLSDYDNPDLDYQRISEDINKEITTLINEQDNKIGRKILVVVCPVSTTISWQDYFLSQFMDIPTGFPLFILTCRVKNCKFCRERSALRRITTYCGISIPLEDWYRNLYYKNDLYNIKNTSIPYGDNKVGIITAILHHGFHKKNQKTEE